MMTLPGSRFLPQRHALAAFCPRPELGYRSPEEFKSNSPSGRLSLMHSVVPAEGFTPQRGQLSAQINIADR